ncbi:MAG: hypothetical protein IKR13_00710 [Victivallales bacterium]|nr:hypothetical protein [Victivallales bacterium]
MLHNITRRIQPQPAMRYLLISLIFLVFLTTQVHPQEAPAPAEDTAWQTELAGLARLDAWQKRTSKLPQITPEALDQAIEGARYYIISQQTSRGNFRYSMDLTDPAFSETSDNAVRQAGTLWSICNLNRDRFNEPTRQACLLAMDFFIHYTRPLPNSDLKVITYKSDRRVKTGMVALFCLGVVDFLTGQEKYMTPEQRQPYLDTLYENLRFLRSQEMPNGCWAKEYSNDPTDPPLPPGEEPETSSYYNGEAMLAYLFAARYYRDRPELTAPEGLVERIHYAMPLLLRRYAVECLRSDEGMAETKGFFQWGLMSCALYHDLFPDSIPHVIENAALTLSWWQIFNNRMDTRNGNTAYAIEGLIAAWHIAHQNGKAVEAQRIRDSIENTLAKLMTWQVGGPFESYNPFLMKWKDKTPAAAYGGVTATAASGYIRIDNVQHQLHAMLLARQYLWP